MKVVFSKNDYEFLLKLYTVGITILLTKTYYINRIKTCLIRRMIIL